MEVLDGSDDAALQARFEVLYMLGRGAYGTVWKAHDRQLGQPVAIKVIPLVDTDKEELQAIQKEIHFLAGCNHPNIVKYLGSCRHRHELWIIMEYCGGGSVSDLLSATQRPMPEAAIAYVCGEALKGLTYLHSLNKVHRDIKCGNILLTDTGAVKLADFGVAAQLTATMSKRQTFIGTPHWMAPEVIQESRYDGKVDVWALGISAIEMAELTPPRWAVHPLRVIFMISREPPPRLTNAPDTWSPLFHDYLEQCLTKEPKSRPTARLLLQHRFVLQQQQQGAEGGTGDPRGFTELLPLVDLSMRYLSHVAASADMPSGQGGVLEMAQQATGHFSWRNVPAQGGTVLAGGHIPRPGAPNGAEADAGDEAQMLPRMPEPSESPAAVGLAGRGGRARMAGAAPTTPTAQHMPSQAGNGDHAAAATSPQESGYDSTVAGFGGTVVLHGGDTLGALVARRRTHEPPHSPSGVPSAYNTARAGTQLQDSGGAGGYLAAVRAAAVEAQRERDRAQPSPQPSPSHGLEATAVAAAHATPKDESARMVERLHAVYESGLVVTTPFLPALHSQPLSLLVPLSSMQCTDTDVIHGMDGSVYRVLAMLVAQSAAMMGQAEAATTGSQSDISPPPVPAHLLERVCLQPEIQNCLRTLAYNLAALAALPLGTAAALELQQSIDDMSQALSAMLLSGMGLS